MCSYIPITFVFFVLSSADQLRLVNLARNVDMSRDWSFTLGLQVG